MKNLLTKFIGINLMAIFLFNPGIALAQTSQNSFNSEKTGSEVQEKDSKLEEKTSFSAKKSSCFEFTALYLMYLPKELKKDKVLNCKKLSKNGQKIKYDEEKDKTGKVFQSDFLAKTSIVSDFIYQTPFDPIYREAEGKYGIPWQVLSVIHEMESGRSGDTYLTSYAGATGPMQFLPSTFAIYGIDGNGDGIASINNTQDAIYSAANYLAASGGTSGNLVGALYHYNHDYWYVNTVLYKAKMLGYGA